MQSIYNKLTYIEPESERFICSICLDVYKNPATLSCGHTFCFNEINKLDKCPVCRSSFVKKDLIENKAIQNLTKELKIKCPFDENCQWTGVIYNLDNHLRNCNFDKHVIINMITESTRLINEKKTPVIVVRNNTTNIPYTYLISVIINYVLLIVSSLFILYNINFLYIILVIIPSFVCICFNITHIVDISQNNDNNLFLKILNLTLIIFNTFLYLICVYFYNSPNNKRLFYHFIVSAILCGILLITTSGLTYYLR